MRSLRTRWLDDRRRLYVRLLSLTEDLLSASLPTAPNDRELVARQFEEADRAVRDSVAEIELIGGDEEVEAAKRLRTAARQLGDANRYPASGTAVGTALQEFERAYSAFKTTARRAVLQPGD